MPFEHRIQGNDNTIPPPAYIRSDSIFINHSIHPSSHNSLFFNPALFLFSSLLGDTNNTASGTGTSVTSLLALLVLALAEVVGAGVHDDGAAEDALRADQLDELVRDAALGIALAVGLEVAQVADVALAVGGGAVGLVVGVDYEGRGGRVSELEKTLVRRKQLTVRAGAGAAVGVVTESVDVHATLGVGVVAGHVPGDLGVGRLGGLLEGDGALDVGVTTDDGDYEGRVPLAGCVALLVSRRPSILSVLRVMRLRLLSRLRHEIQTAPREGLT